LERWDATVAEHRLRNLERDVGTVELELAVAELLLG
jgi:hypothetical protein